MRFAESQCQYVIRIYGIQTWLDWQAIRVAESVANVLHMPMRPQSIAHLADFPPYLIIGTHEQVLKLGQIN